MNTISDRLDACDEYDAAVVEEGYRTPTREGSNFVAKEKEGYRTPPHRSRRIATPKVCPPPPKKKRRYKCSESLKRERGYDVVVEEKQSSLREDGCFEVHLIDEVDLEQLFKTISTGEADAMITEEDKGH